MTECARKEPLVKIVYVSFSPNFILIKIVRIIIFYFFLDEGSCQQSTESPIEFSDSDTDSEAASDSGSGSDTEEDAQTPSKVHLLRHFKGKQMTVSLFKR